MTIEKITLKEAQDKIATASDEEVAAAYKLARQIKESGRLNMEDIRRALKQARKMFMKKELTPTGLSGKKDGPDLTNRASGGAIRRRGGGIAKRGMGIAK